MSGVFVILAVVALMIFFNALYVGAEFGAVSARRTRIERLAADGDRFAKALLPIMQDTHKLDDYVAACQLGITISSLVIGAYGESQVAPLLHPLLQNLGIGSATEKALTVSVAATSVLILFTFLQVILGELFPKSIAVEYPEKMALFAVYPVKLTMFILRPLIWLFNGSGSLLLRLFGIDDVNTKANLHSAEEIEILVTGSHEGGLLDDEERQLLRNAFRLGELTAHQVMIHRTRLTIAAHDSSPEDLLNLAIDAGFSRIPIYEDNLDNIIGFVHVKDAFRLLVQNQNDIGSIIRDVVYVPETSPIVDVWEKLNEEYKYVAIVFDEYGSTVGMISFEDLIEEIFGELQDEFDNEEALVRISKDGRIHLQGALLVTDINEYLELQLPEDIADTIGGLVISAMGQIPQSGEEVYVTDTIIRVEKMDEMSVREVSLPIDPEFVIPSSSEWEVIRD